MKYLSASSILCPARLLPKDWENYERTNRNCYEDQFLQRRSTHDGTVKRHLEQRLLVEKMCKPKRKRYERKVKEGLKECCYEKERTQQRKGELFLIQQMTENAQERRKRPKERKCVYKELEIIEQKERQKELWKEIIVVV